MNILPQIEAVLKTYLEMRRDPTLDALNGRLARAYRLTSTGQVTQTADNQWTVKSQSSRALYAVTFNPTTHTQPGWQCTCLDCGPGGHAPRLDFAGGVQPTCKHIVAVAIYWSVCDQSETVSDFKSDTVSDLPAVEWRNGQHADICPRCGQGWRRCGCQSVGDQRQAARDSLNLPQGQPKHRPAYQLTGIHG